ncbi:MAG: hypothetical protein ACOX9R_08465 [Armatimonadota bacterium]|jgi:hypothetical protein
MATLGYGMEKGSWLNGTSGQKKVCQSVAAEAVVGVIASRPILNARSYSLSQADSSTKSYFDLKHYVNRCGLWVEGNVKVQGAILAEEETRFCIVEHPEAAFPMTGGVVDALRHLAPGEPADPMIFSKTLVVGMVDHLAKLAYGKLQEIDEQGATEGFDEKRFLSEVPEADEIVAEIAKHTQQKTQLEAELGTLDEAVKNTRVAADEQREVDDAQYAITEQLISLEESTGQLKRSLRELRRTYMDEVLESYEVEISISAMEGWLLTT